MSTPAMQQAAPDADWVTLREIDRACGAAKGSAFRAFKRLAAEAREGEDFIVLDARCHREPLDQLRAAGRVYANTVNTVLLAPAFAARVQAMVA